MITDTKLGMRFGGRNEENLASSYFTILVNTKILSPCITIISVSQCRDVGPFCLHLGYNLSLSLFTSFRGAQLNFADTGRKTRFATLKLSRYPRPETFNYTRKRHLRSSFSSFLTRETLIKLGLCVSSFPFVVVLFLVSLPV